MYCDFESIDGYKLFLALKIGSARHFDKLIAKYGDAETVYKNMDSIHEEIPTVLTEANISSMKKISPSAFIERIYKAIRDIDVDIIFKDDERYFKNLKMCADAPNVLFVRGHMPLDESKTVGIVGTRDYTNYGAEVTDEIAYSLARHGVAVVSGMAAGIDRIAAYSALRAKNGPCATIAVLGSGVDVPTPAENEKLYESICEGGLVVSQFEPGARATKYTYPIRNKVIAGISDCLVVTEAGEKSGALITARAALKYGRKLFCVAGRMTDPSYKGANALIASSEAQSIESVDDILNSLNVGKSVVLSENKAVPVRKHTKSEEKSKLPLDAEEQLIYNALKKGEKTFDELYEITNIDVPSLNLNLTTMELLGIIKQSQGRVYSLRDRL